MKVGRDVSAGSSHASESGGGTHARWTAVQGAASWAPPLFIGSYAVAEADGRPPSWQHFPDRLFDTKEHAADFVLGEAHRAIDRRNRT